VTNPNQKKEAALVTLWHTHTHTHTHIWAQ